ncbi:MAG TPA: hypothetical protein PLQ97_11740 [Myxococcota bacterium]|nr:hypothetical protein [Myxococcota bacterium]HQK51431.1 hypothetical protein [Myxococcota bacterium]
MDPIPPSRRARKRLVQQGVRRLRALPGWDPARRVPDPDPLAGPRGALEDARQAEVALQAASCPDCAARRQEEGDPTALCDRHLAAALGTDPSR